jgi:arginine exporter protein ArgO
MTDSPAQPPINPNDPPSAPPADPPEKAVGTRDGVQRTRALTGLFVVVMGDLTIVAAAIIGLVVLGADSQAVAILTSAFTAISSITTAYFGIRAATNTAQSSIAARQE